jgi:hypothetical protein
MDDAPAVSDPTADSPGRTMLCPACGYDLRGTTGERCSECGLEIDREALKRSGFPWAHRASLGRLRAFLMTVWLMTIDSKALRNEAAKAQAPRDAAVFRRWVAATLAACFLWAAVLVISNHVVARAVYDRYESGADWEWTGDLFVPWLTGLAMEPLLLSCALAAAAYMTGATRPIFRTRDLPGDYAQVVEPISGYVTGPLAWVLSAFVAFLGLRWLFDHYGHVLRFMPVVRFLLVSGNVALAVMGIGGAVHRTGQWRARTAHAGYSTAFLAMGELLLRWGVGCFVILGLIPWCVGFTWIVIDSYRR